MRRAMFACRLALGMFTAALLNACGTVSTPEVQIELPALEPGTTVMADRARYRVVLGGTIATDSGVWNQVHVHQKTSTGRHFTLEGSILWFEGIVGKALLVSEGTGSVRSLRAYDVQSGELIHTMQYDKADVHLIFEDDTHFSYYAYDDEAPFTSWDGEKWVASGEIPDGMPSQECEATLQSLRADDLFTGYTLQLHRRVRVDLEACAEELLEEYAWAPAE